MLGALESDCGNITCQHLAESVLQLRQTSFLSNKYFCFDLLCRASSPRIFYLKICASNAAKPNFLNRKFTMCTARISPRQMCILIPLPRTDPSPPVLCTSLGAVCRSAPISPDELIECGRGVAPLLARARGKAAKSAECRSWARWGGGVRERWSMVTVNHSAQISK